MDADFKYLSVFRLRELLDSLPEDWLVAPSAVGNLALWDDEGDFKGYIDFLWDGTIEVSDRG